MNAIRITEAATRKLQAWMDAAEGEVSGMASCRLTEGIIEIYDAYLWHQECGFASTDAAPNGKAELYERLITQGTDMNSVRVWWHSHASFGGNFSGVDRDTMRQEADSMPWLVALLGSQKREWFAQVEITEPMRCNIDWGGVDAPSVQLTDADMVQARADIAQYVVRHVYPSFKPWKQTKQTSESLLLSGAKDWCEAGQCERKWCVVCTPCMDARFCGCKECTEYIAGGDLPLFASHWYSQNYDALLSIEDYADDYAQEKKETQYA